MSRGTSLTSHETGTLRGWRWHTVTGTIACAPCLRAHASAEQKRRNKGRCAKGLGWPL